MAALEEALAHFRALGDRWWEGAILMELAATVQLEDDRERAEVRRGGLACCRAAGDRLVPAVALGGLGYLARQAGDLGKAATYWTESLACARAMRFQVPMVGALEGLASVAAAAGQAEQATRLFGAAAALFEAVGAAIPSPWADPANFASSVARLRAELGEAPFAAAWEAGRALSLEAAAAEALAVGTEREGGTGLRAADPAAAAGLTPREAEILRLLVAGRTNPEIAKALFLSPRTVATHLTHVFAKLGVANRAEAVAAALRRGLA